MVGEFEKEMMRLSDNMSKHSPVCTVTRMRITTASMEEEEKIMNRRLMEARDQERNILGRKCQMVGRMEGWKKAEEMCRQLVMELAGICEVTKGKMEEKKGDISLINENMNTSIYHVKRFPNSYPHLR